jgi:Fur family peroxide stress response transcriptional regulator
VPSQERLEAFEALCRRHGLPVTIQRRVIYEFVCDRKDHPTAEQVYDGVRDRIRGVSRMTVYRVLDALVRIDALKKVCSPGSTTRFDPNTARHHHLVCLHCGKLVDYEDPSLNDLPIPDARSRGFHVDDYSIQFRGICTDCKKLSGESSHRKKGSTIHRKRPKKP